VHETEERTGDRRRETEDGATGRRETGTEDGVHETEDGRWKTGPLFHDYTLQISES